MYKFTIVVAPMEKKWMMCQGSFGIGNLERNCRCLHMSLCFQNDKYIPLHLHMQLFFYNNVSSTKRRLICVTLMNLDANLY